MRNRREEGTCFWRDRMEHREQKHGVQRAEAEQRGSRGVSYLLRAPGWREEPAGDRPHHQLPQGALGAGRRGRQDLQRLLCPGGWRSHARGVFAVYILFTQMLNHL